MTNQPSSGISHIISGVDDLFGKVADWYETKRDQKSGQVNANVMCAGLYVSQHLASALPLSPGDYRTKKGQVKGAGGPQAAKILAKHGEDRPFLAEGGRTSRATISFADELVEIINSWAAENGKAQMGSEDRQLLSHALQSWFVRVIQNEYFAKQRISAVIDPAKPVRVAVMALLEAGRQRGGTAAGAIAQHLVGAKLSLRFPDQKINVESYTTADQQTARAGDFQVHDTAIHVTMNPSESLFTVRCRNNLNHGYRPRVLVPEHKVAAAYQLAENAGMHDRIAVQSVEDFVGTNIEEIAQFETGSIKSGLRALLEKYNERIASAEADKSLMVEIPANL